MSFMKCVGNVTCLDYVDVNILYKKAETEMNNLFNWFGANKSSLNSAKTKYIVIRPHMKQLNLNRHKFNITGTPLSKVWHNCTKTAIKFLGIYIDEFLTWKKTFSIHQFKHCKSNLFP